MLYDIMETQTKSTDMRNIVLLRVSDTKQEYDQQLNTINNYLNTKGITDAEFKSIYDQIKFERSQGITHKRSNFEQTK